MSYNTPHYVSMNVSHTTRSPKSLCDHRITASFNTQGLILTFLFFIFLRERERAGGRGKLGAYACDINTKVEVSANWGSLVLTEHFIMYCFAFFPPKNFNSGNFQKS